MGRLTDPVPAAGIEDVASFHWSASYAALSHRREFPAGLNIPQNKQGDETIRQVIENNAADGVTWLYSYVTLDHLRSFCLYDGPSPEAVRRTAARNSLPITRITEVRILIPYAYRASDAT